MYAAFLYAAVWACFGGMLVGISFGIARSSAVSCSVNYFGPLFSITKSISIGINISLSMLLIQPLIRYSKTFFRVPMSTVHLVHFTVAVPFVVLSCAHLIINSYIASRFFGNAYVTSTGVLLAIVIAVLVASSSSIGRAKHYTTFIVMHYVCFTLMVILLPVHANFCYFKYNDGRCISAATKVVPWLFPIFCLPFLITMTKFMPWIRGNKVTIEQVVKYPENIIKIVLKNFPKRSSGKTVYIARQNPFSMEWHPYTFVKNDTIIMKIRGDWTRALARELGVCDGMVTPAVYPALLFDGPFMSCLGANEMRNAVLVATGIGLTSFADMLVNGTFVNCYIVIVVKHLGELQWFWELKPSLSISIILFITRDALNSIAVDDLPDNVVQISFRRPNWGDTLSRLEAKGVRRVYYAGVPGVKLSKFTKMRVVEGT